MRMVGICNGDLHCCTGTTWSFGSYTRDLHIDLVAQAGGNSIRHLISPLPWIYDVDVPTSNPQYGGLRFRDYIKALVDYGHQVGISTFLDLQFQGSKVQAARMIRNQPNDYLTDIYGSNGMQRQNWVTLGREIIQHCAPDVIGVGDEWFGCDSITNYTNSSPGDLMTSPDYRLLLTACIEDWRVADPNVVIAVQGMRHRNFQPFWDVDALMACPSTSFLAKGEGPLPYPNILYVMNAPGYGSPTDVYSYLDNKAAYFTNLLATQYPHLNARLGFTCSFADAQPPTQAQLDYLAQWLTYQEERDYDCWVYGFTKGGWNVLTLDFLGWNQVGQAWADFVTPQPPECSRDADCESLYGPGWYCHLGKCLAPGPIPITKITLFPLVREFFSQFRIFANLYERFDKWRG